ncbi:MAG: hypothetical protein RR508_08910, partial [Oscillospiraceae bacterium]
YGQLKIDELYEIGGKKYYSNTMGLTAHGVHTVNGKTYSFTGEHNAAQSGRLPLGNGKYGTFDPITFELVVGKSGWVDLGNGQKAYADQYGEYLTGTQTISGACYYFDASGVMQTGWQKIYGGWAYYEPSQGDKNGKLKISEFYTVNGNTYYSAGNGYRVTGTQAINGACYYFDASGV